MIQPKQLCHSLCLFFTCLSVLIGCGKKQEESSNSPTVTPTPRTVLLGAELIEFLDKQIVACGPDGCPDYINKIAVVDRGEVRFCTGFLTDTGTVATAASCLPDLVRFQGQNCDNEVFFFFPATSSKPAVRAGCRRVLQVSRIDGAQPELWRENIAFLELDQNIYRRSLKVSREGIADKRRLDIWKVDQVDSKYIGIVRREECTAVHDTYINPLASHKFSPTMVLGNCSFLDGNSGAPLIDSTGKLRAIATSDIDKNLITILKNRGFLEGTTVSSMLYANNMACTPNIDDNEGYPDRECVKELSESAMARARGTMTDEKTMFSYYLKDTYDAIATNNKFVNFDVKLVENAKGKYNVHFYPKCFIDSEQWRNRPPKTKSFTVSAPYYEIARGMDSYTRLKVNMSESKNTQFRIEFLPREVIAGTSPVSIKSTAFSASFSNIPSSCSSQQIQN